MKRCLILIVPAIILLNLLAGCDFVNGQTQGVFVNISVQQEGSRILSPVEPSPKPGGGKYTLAYVDIDPYPITGAVLYYIISGLREEGWIKYDNLPFDAANIDAGELIDWLAGQDLGPYIQFDRNANYYIEYTSVQEIERSLKEHIENGRVDIVITMGTGSAQICKSFGLDVPVMMFGVTNPVESGLIDSIYDSGNPLIWATFDPTAYERQLIYYHDCIPFENLGILYYDESIASLNSYQKAAEELGVRITHSKILRIDSPLYKSDDDYYEKLKAEYTRMIEEDGIDAFMLTTDTITDIERISGLLEIFTDNGIPVFVQVGEIFVEHGALMNVSAIEMEGSGVFGARAITHALSGTPLVEIPQEYKNSPYLTLNLDTANRINFKPTFEMLLSCERVYR